MRNHSHRRGLYAPELLEARIAPATIIVNSLLDNGDGANTTLREAIGLANNPVTHPGADTIIFKIPAAMLPGTIVLNGTNIAITDTLTITGLGVDLLTISGNDLSRIFNINDGTAALKSTVLSGFTLSEGKSGTDGGAILSLEPLTLKNMVIRGSYATARGGGVYVKTEGKVSITGSKIVHNQAGDGGGGLYLRANAGVSVVKSTIADNTAKIRAGLYAAASGGKTTVVIDGCTISNNVASTGDGGGLGLNGINSGKITLKNSLITGNSAAGVGGGVHHDNGTLTVTNTTFSNNTAERGGGLASNNFLIVSGSRFLANQSTAAGGPGGGAIYVDALAGTVMKIGKTVFSGNHANNFGGAISHAQDLSMIITGSSFLGNSADVRGGAMSLHDAATFTITGSSFLGNSAVDGAGAIQIIGAFLTLKTSSVSGNSAVDGGALHAQGVSVIDLISNKFTENRGSYGGAIHLTGDMSGNAPYARLKSNLFQGNLAALNGGAILSDSTTVFFSQSDKLIGNVAKGQGGGAVLNNTAGIFLTGTLFQGNVAGSSGGGASIGGGADISGIKVLDNIAGPGGRGGGLRIAGAINVIITKSLITGNVANDGGGIFYNIGTTTLLTTIVKNNAALINPNLGRA